MRAVFLIISLFLLNLSFASEITITGNSFSPSKNWQRHSKTKKEAFKNLFRMLIKSETGKALLVKANDKAKSMGHTLYDLLEVGHGSLTDTTLIRKFSPQNPDEITYETLSKVVINRDLNQFDALLDLAHELTHFVYREGFNPYQSNFTLAEFIQNTIEGVGGEAQAFMVECKVLSELFPDQKDSRYNCHQIQDPDTGKFSNLLTVQKFYQLGDYFDNFANVLNKRGIRHHFPKLTDEKASFVSSAYGIPYPVAAFEEYLSVLNKVCKNDQKRISYFKESQVRAPASLSALESSFKSRCGEWFN